MNTSFFKLKGDISGNVLDIHKDINGEYDEIAFRVIRSDKPYFSAAVTEVSINGEEIYKYELGDYIPIRELTLNMTSREFIDLLKKITRPLAECTDWLLDSSCIVLKPDYVFVSKYDYDIRYIYSFDMNNRCTLEEISDFFKWLLGNVRLSDSSTFENEILRMVIDNRDSNITLASILELIKRNDNKEPAKKEYVKRPEPRPVTVSEPVKQEKPVKKKDTDKNPLQAVVSQVMDMADQEKKFDPAKDHYQEEADAVEQQLFGSDKDTKKKKKEKEKKPEKSIIPKFNVSSISNLFPKKKNEAPNQNENSETQSAYDPQTYQGDETEFSGVTDNGETVFAGVGAALTLKINNGGLDALPRIELPISDGSSVEIGRKSGTPPFADVLFDYSFKRIGRHHARISRKGEDYFITDLSSVNHTFVNGEQIPPETPRMLSDKDTVIFGDADYVYEFEIQ